MPADRKTPASPPPSQQRGERAGSGSAAGPMKGLLLVFSVLHGLIALLLVGAAVALITIATRIGWTALEGDLDQEAAQHVIEAVGLLAAAVVALQISQTIAEEEIVRDAHISAPTRVRRFLSRFFVVVIVALAIEGLVASFKAIHEDLAQLVYAAALLVSTGAMLAAWGVFVKLNRSAEELEPDAMEQAKEENRKFE